MIKFKITILFLLGAFCFLEAQRLHAPKEIIRIMNQSKISYKMVDLDSIERVNRYSLVRGWPEEKGGTFSILPYQIESDPAYQKNYLKGEKQFRKKRWSKAIKSYKKAYRSHPEDIQLLNRLGEAYLYSDDPFTAIYWFKKSLQINYHDYKTHRLCAEAYLKNKNSDLARQHILTAHLLNRLDDKTLERVYQIFEQSQAIFANWELLPKCRIDSPRLGHVHVAADGKPWMAYANVVALWDYEPGYRIKMSKISNQNGQLIQLKESMLNALIIYDELPEEEQKDFPELGSFKKALHSQFLNEYLVYEKLSLVNPTMLYGYNEAGLKRFVTYLIKHRVSDNNENIDGSNK